MEGRGGGLVIEKESIFVTISGKIGDTYVWLRDKLISLFKLISEPITKAFLGLNSFVTSCCEKIREVLSGINTQLDNLDEKKLMVDYEVVPEQASLLGEMKMLVQKMRRSVNQWLGNGNSHEMKAAHLKLIGFLDLSERFIELLEYAFEKPLLLIPRIVDAFFIYSSSKKTGR